ncbi:MAG: hypothetical protein ACI30A_06165 [Paludibacteraceae bacterium]
MSDFYTKVLSLKIRSIQLLFFPNITSMDENNAKLYGKKIFTFDKDGGEFVASYVSATIDNASASVNNAFLVVVHHFPKGLIQVGGGKTYYQLESIYDFLQPMNVKAIRHPLFGESYELYLVFGTASMWGETDAQRKQNILYYLFGEGSADGNVDVLNHTFTIDGFMLQKGNKATTYQPYVEHLTNALKGTTEVAGGLVMTNVLMLKNEENEVTAGMSGLVGTKDNPENVLMWGGGTYADAFAALQGLKKLPVLLTKTGYGSNIGCLKVMDDNESIAVESESGERIIITNKSIEDVFVQQSAYDIYLGNMGIGNNFGYSETWNGVYDDPETGNASLVREVRNVAAGKYKLTMAATEFELSVSASASGASISGMSITLYADAYAYIDDIYLNVYNNGVLKESIQIGDETDLEVYAEAKEGYNDGDTDKAPIKIKAVNTTINVDSGTLDIRLESSIVDFRVSRSDGGTLTSASALLDTNGISLSVLGIDKCTVLAKNGLSIVVDAKHSFSINNSTEELSISAIGLPTSNDKLRNGSLWVDSNNNVKITKK